METIVIVRAPELLTHLPNNTRELILPDGACNNASLTELSLTGLKDLERVVIGNHSLTHVDSVSIQNNENLKKVVIGSHSFSTSIRTSALRQQHKRFHVQDCPQLSELIIEEGVFFDYTSLLLESMCVVL